jgi:Rrf2 family protein
MKLNATTDYAVRATVYLAMEGRVVPGAEIAHKMEIPHTYLVSVMAKLKRAGIVDVKRGQSGGYFLAKAQERVSMWDIMSAVERTMSLNSCLEDGVFYSHDPVGFGHLQGVYHVLQGIMEGYLRGVTLEKLVD